MDVHLPDIMPRDFRLGTMNDKNTHPRRLPGLDTLRALAIAWVLMTHYSGFVSGQQTFGALGRVGWSGVDLFFVLSGFLITGILYDTRNSERFFQVFYARRALRRSGPRRKDRARPSTGSRDRRAAAQTLVPRAQR